MFSTKINKTFYYLLLTFCFTGAVLYAAPSKIENIYKKRLLGDQAFNDGLYDLALNYYKQYLENTGTDTDAARDSYYCLIATCLKASNIKEAEIFYDKVASSNEDFFKRNALAKEKLNYWRGEILLAKGLNQEAENIFSEVVKNTVEKDKETYVAALIGLGSAQIRLKKWYEAEASFTRVKNAAETQDDKTTALEQMILINLVCGKFEIGKQLIAELSKTKDNSNTYDLFNIYALIKENKIEEAENEYSSVSAKLKETDNLLTYIVLSAFADSYIENKGYEKALNKLQLAFSKAPNLFEKETIAILTLNTLIDAKKYKEAAASSVMFLDFFPDSILKDKILLLYTDILIEQKTSPKQILSSIDKYYKFSDNPFQVQVEIASRIGKVLYKIKDYENALKYFHYCYKNGTTRSQCGEGMYWSAKCYIMMNDSKTALEELLKIDSKIPEWEDKAMLEISLIYLQQKEFSAAKDELELLMKKYPKNSLIPSPAFLYAVALSGNNELKAAIEQYIAFAEENKDSELAPDAYCRAGDLCLRLTDFERATDCYQKVLDIYPKSELIPEVLYKLLYSYYLAGGYSKAIEVVNDLNKKYPQTDYALQASLWLVDYYTGNKEYEKALNQLDEIIKDKSNDADSANKILIEKADILSKMDKNKEAVACINDLLSKTEDDNLKAKAYFLKGDIESKLDKFDSAIEDYKSVMEFKTQNDLKIAAQGRIGDCYFAVINFSDNRNQTIDLAIKAYKELLNIENISKFITIQTNYKLGKCYELLGDKKKAIQYYHEALYENVINIEEGADADKEWMGKAGIALAGLLDDENTKESAQAAIKVYQILIKNNIQPEDSFQEIISKIKKQYKIED